MMKGLILTLGLVGTFKLSYGQVSTDSLILTKAQNDAWISQLARAPIDVQLDLIKDRMLLDTNVYVRENFADRIRFQDESENGKKIESHSRPFIVIDGKCQDYHVNITNSTKNESIRQLVGLLTVQNIKLVTLHNDDKAAAIYGSRAIGGVIILSAKNRTVRKKLERIEWN